jgi:hypothetical protein
MIVSVHNKHELAGCDKLGVGSLCECAAMKADRQFIDARTEAAGFFSIGFNRRKISITNNFWELGNFGLSGFSYRTGGCYRRAVAVSRDGNRSYRLVPVKLKSKFKSHFKRLTGRLDCLAGWLERLSGR